MRACVAESTELIVYVFPSATTSWFTIHDSKKGAAAVTTWIPLVNPSDASRSAYAVSSTALLMNEKGLDRNVARSASFSRRSICRRYVSLLGS